MNPTICPCCKVRPVHGYRIYCYECEEVLARDDEERELAQAYAIVRRREGQLEEERVTWTW